MKNNVPASDRPASPEESKSRDRWKRLTALAASALFGVTIAKGPEQVDLHALPPAPHVFHDSQGDRVIIDPSMVVTLPGRKQDSVELFYPNHPTSEEVSRSAANYCEVVDVPLPKQFDYKEIEQGAHTEFILSTEKFRTLDSKLAVAHSIKEAQEIMDTVLDELGIEAKFDGPLRSYYIPHNGQPDPENNLSDYSYGMRQVLSALAVLPHEALDSFKSINFLNASVIAKKDEDGESRAAGTFSTSGEITLPILRASGWIVVHEVTHGLHFKACRDFSDTELQKEFNLLKAYLNAHPEMRELEERAQDKKTRLTPNEYDRFIHQGKVIGLPTAYSRASYLELMADLTTKIIYDGNSFILKASASAEERESAWHIREMVVERLQKAMPGVDVTAWLQYINAYNGSLPTALDPKEAIEHRVSRLDGTYAYFKYYEDQQGNDQRLVPAVAVRGGRGEPIQYIYAYHRGQDYVDMMINIDKDAPAGSSDDLLFKAAMDYLNRLSDDEAMKLRIIQSDKTYTGTGKMVNIILSKG